MSEQNVELCGKYKLEAASPLKYSAFTRLSVLPALCFAPVWFQWCGPAVLLTWWMSMEKGPENAALWPQAKLHEKIPLSPVSPSIFIFKFHLPHSKLCVECPWETFMSSGCGCCLLQPSGGGGGVFCNYSCLRSGISKGNPWCCFRSCL